MVHYSVEYNAISYDILIYVDAMPYIQNNSVNIPYVLNFMGSLSESKQKIKDRHLKNSFKFPKHKDYLSL